MEDLTKTWSKLKLSECEGSSVRLLEEHAETEWVLAAKFLTRRVLNLEAIAKTFSPLWRASKGFQVRREEDHIVLLNSFSFSVPNQQNHVMEDLTKTWSKLKLSDSEGSSVRLLEEHAVTDWVLAAKFLTKRVLNLEAIAKTFSPLWRASKGFQVRREEDHIVLFTFKDQSDMQKVLAGEPWSFDKYLVIMQKFDGSEDVRNMGFELATFWIQVHDLPLRFRNRRVAEKLCEVLGTVNHEEQETDLLGVRFVRVRVTLNISKPLCRGRVITLEDGKDLWIPFKYERLPNLCYRCGCLLHDEQNCVHRYDSEENQREENTQFGPWLRASPFLPSRSKLVTVPGLKEQSKKTNQLPNPIQSNKGPVMVVRTDSPSPVVIRPENQESFLNPEVMMDPVFQQKGPTPPEVVQSDMTEADHVQASELVMDVAKEAGKTFEETLEDLDRDIERYEAPPICNLEIPSPLGPSKPSPTCVSPSPVISNPLANITNLSPSLSKPTSTSSTKWTRIMRQVGSIEESEDLNVALGKRVALLPHCDTKHPKRRAMITVEQKENIFPSVEAGSQPRRDQ